MKSDKAMSKELWSIETMLKINALTPDIKGKAFDPDWFLLRQRLEEVDTYLTEIEHQKAKNAELCDCLQRVLDNLYRDCEGPLYEAVKDAKELLKELGQQKGNNRKSCEVS